MNGASIRFFSETNTLRSISFKREKYIQDNFLNQTTMAVAWDNVCSTAYCVDGDMRVLLYASVYNTVAQTKTDIAAETKQ